MTERSHHFYPARLMTDARLRHGPRLPDYGGHGSIGRGGNYMLAKISALFLALAVLTSAGCDMDLDPDTLVRELRVLGIRFGDASPASEADVLARVTFGAGGQPDVSFSRPEMRFTALAAAPTGPGRRLASPRPLRYDWFVCVGPLSLFSPGVLDSACRKVGPNDPPARQNTSLLPLAPAATTDPSLVVPAATLKQILSLFLQVYLSPRSGSGGGMVTLPERPVVLLVPIVLEVRAEGGDVASPLDREVAFSFLRVIITLPGMEEPPANRNPSLLGQGGIFAGSDEDPMSRREIIAPCPPENVTGEATGSLPACVRYPVNRTAPTYLVGRSDAGSVETYVPIDDSGRGPQAELLRYSWFATDGSLSEERTGDKSPQTKWENGERRPAPAEVRVVDLWLVVQDGRGGTDFQRVQLGLM